jgi:hypothetical protein
MGRTRANEDLHDRTTLHMLLLPLATRGSISDFAAGEVQAKEESNTLEQEVD